MNGEYANANRQDSGTAIYDLYKEKVYRYSVLEKDDFKVMKVNFFKDIESGFSLISSYFQEQSLGATMLTTLLLLVLKNLKAQI